METLNLKDLKYLKLTANELKDIIRFIAKKRSTTSKKILENINLNKKLTETQRKLTKTQQKLIKTQQKIKQSRKSCLELTEKHQKLIEKKQKLIESWQSQQKIIKLQKLQIESRELIKPIKSQKSQQKITNLQKSEQKKNKKKTVVSQQKLIKSRELIKPPQQPSPKRIDDISRKLNELKHNFPKIEFNKIRKNLYNLKNKNKLSKKSSKYLNELNKKIINFDKHGDFIGLENVKDLYSILEHKPVLTKAGVNKNYLEYGSDGNNSLSFMKYLNLIKPYLEDLINEKKNKGEWKLQLTAKISFVSLKPDSDETRLMHTRSNAPEFMNGSETAKIIESLYRSLLQNYNDNLQEKMKGSDFVFNGINYFYYDFNRVSIGKDGSYIDFPKWLKDKKSTVNQNNNDNKCFQYATTPALNFNKIDKNPQRISRIKLWNDINFPANRKDWNKFEVNNKNVAVNILDVPFNTKKIEIAYKSKYNLVRDNQIILLMISNSENWHYLAVKSLSRLLRGITSNHDGDYYCLNCFHSYRTENKLKSHKNVRENHYYCNTEMPSNDNNLINYNKGDKSFKLSFAIYAYLECLLEKISTCYNNPNLSSTSKINQHVPSGYSVFTNCSFDKSFIKVIYKSL